MAQHACPLNAFICNHALACIPVVGQGSRVGGNGGSSSMQVMSWTVCCEVGVLPRGLSSQTPANCFSNLQAPGKLQASSSSILQATGCVKGAS
jgi:hypothetical protein